MAWQDPRRDPSQILTRQALVHDVTSKGLLNLVPEPIKQLYAILESEFSPLHLCQKLAPLLEQLESMDEPLSAASPVHDVSLGQYKNTLQQVATKTLTGNINCTEPVGLHVILLWSGDTPLYHFGRSSHVSLDGHMFPSALTD